ncbi:MAG: efflux RND transporter periplasmic adaptor subunit, partial [Sphingomonadales bacterium]
MATDPKKLDEFLGTPAAPWWRRYVKWVAIGVGVLLLVLLAFRLFGGSTEVRYATQPVERGNLTVTVSATGKLAPTNQVTVGSELSGLVENVTADVNDRVV